MKIPVAKPYLTKDEVVAVGRTILSGWVTQGPRVEEFETKFAKYIGCKYAVAVSSCTAALHLALIVNGIKPNDEVICPSLSFIATANAIRYLGAKPVFADVREDTYNIDPGKIEGIITKYTKAILIVHQIGLPADIDAFKIICRKHNLKLIEDAACALGSSYKNKKIGSHSDTVCFSFHPRKVITTGDGGMITTSKKHIYERLKTLRQHGMSVSDQIRHHSRKIVIEDYLELGYNYRMTDIQAAIGIKQLEKLDWIIKQRRLIAKKYNNEFIKNKNLVVLKESKGYYTNFQSYCIRLDDYCRIARNDLMQKLLDKGIATKAGILTIHKQKAYKDLRYNINLPISEKASKKCIILPLWVPMTDKEINYVVDCVTELTSL